MDWFSVVLLIAFVLLPLIQQLLERARQAQIPEEEPPATESPMERGATEQRSTGMLGGAAPPEVEWGETLEDRLEALSREDVLEEDRAREMTTLQEVLPADATEVSRVSVPVVSLESLEVDRGAEHARLHRRMPPRRSAPRPPASGPSRAAALLEEEGGLRRAILVSEVLGPPRSLQ